jgi:murein DD-endopeptidase MepM/ murein hydrolase activator NlpD
MKRYRVAFSERWGGFMRVRALMAIFPMAIPLFLTSDIGGRTASSPTPSGFPPSPAIRYELLDTPPANLPAHVVYLPIEQGDTLESLLMTGGLPTLRARQLSAAFAATIDVHKLRKGDLVRVHYDPARTIDSLELKVARWGSVRAERSGDSFEVRAIPAKQSSQQIAVSAPISSSLYEAVRATGETPQLVAELVDIFQWDVDFFALQKDDWFSLVVEKRFSGSDHIGYGPILAARFHHDGETFEAYRFEAPNGAGGYYTTSGTPVRKQFLKSPLKYTRITSGFSRHRFHPILHEYRPHLGVDYGAPVGTPVMSTADGVVVFAARKGGEGNFVRIRHNAHVETGYLHLSHFAKGIRVGARVKQGDVIGYVGATGLATGPHLDYRVCEGGKWINPLLLKSITADPLGGNSLRAFKAAVASYSVSLSGATQLAGGPHAPERHPFGRS